jgi:hypothetical protein
MPSKESGGVENMWYRYGLRVLSISILSMPFSFDYGAVHFISIDTSTDFVDAPEQIKGGSHVFPAGYFAPDGAYMQWVENVGIAKPINLILF